MRTFKTECNDNFTIQKKREETKKGWNGKDKGTGNGLVKEENSGDDRSGSKDDSKIVL